MRIPLFVIKNLIAFLMIVMLSAVGHSQVATNNKSVEDLIQRSVQEIQKQNLTSGSHEGNLPFVSSAKVEKVAQVSSEGHSEIVPTYNDRGVQFTLRYDEIALKKPDTLIRNLAMVYFLSMHRKGNNVGSSIFVFSGLKFHEGGDYPLLSDEIASPHAVSELILNAKKGSPTAQARWAQLQVRMLNFVSLWPEVAAELNLNSNILREEQDRLLEQLPKLKNTAIQYQRKQNKLNSEWKEQTKTLDKFEAMEEKLNDLILKNDRKGVRALLEAYLPWTTMEPIEANSWKIWLEAIEFPDHKNTTIGFRGVDYRTDKIQRSQTSQGEIFGFMSTVLTKNQGSYTRRLRSLTTNREKNGDKGFNNKKSDILSVKIADQILAHSVDPVGSSFISFTSEANIAKRFIGKKEVKSKEGQWTQISNGGFLVVKIDSRRMIPNVTSGYVNEIEYLAPLIVFPDEVMGYREGVVVSDLELEKFLSDTHEKHGLSYKKAVLAEVKELFRQEGYNYLKKIFELPANIQICSKIFLF